MPVEPTILADLAAETPEGEVKQRAALSKGGRPVYKNGQKLMLDYVTARYVQQRLDDVVGPENWQASFTERAGGSIECTISINVWADYLEEGESANGKIKRIGSWISKSDVGVPSLIEPAKGAYSDAFKRAAVHWGIARDLYEERDESDVKVADEPPPTSSIRSRVAGWEEDEGEEEEPRPRPARRPVQQSRPSRGGYRQQTTRGSRNEGRDNELMDLFEQDLQAGDAPWLCPIHEDVQLVPGGVSKQGKPYGPFAACPDRDCNEKGPFLSDLYKGR